MTDREKAQRAFLESIEKSLGITIDGPDAIAKVKKALDAKLGVQMPELPIRGSRHPVRRRVA